MTREEREATIARLQAENAVTLEDLARREARTARGEDDPEDWVVHRDWGCRTAVQRHESAKLVYKTKQTPPRILLSNEEPTLQQTTSYDDAWNEWLQSHLEMTATAIGDELGKLMRKQADDVSARLDELETRLDAVETRLDALEGNSSSKGAGATVTKLRGTVG
jgi:hypothetical protein